MAGVGSFYKGERKKLPKEQMAARAKKKLAIWELPRVEIIHKKKKS